MASYTMELKNVILSCDGDIGLKDYPIFNESHREVLNKKIIDHYFNMEIGIASIDDWVFVLNRTMREIMPLYNQKYESELLAFDPLVTVDMKMVSDSLSDTIRDSITNGVSNTESSSDQLVNQQTGVDSNSSSRVVQGTTPQKRLGGNMDYASAVTDTTSSSATDTDSTSSDVASSTVDGTSNMTANDTSKDTGHGETTSKGYTGSASALLLEFRDTILNIDMEIIEELSDLFMMIWSTGDQYTNNYYHRGFSRGYYPII